MSTNVRKCLKILKRVPFVVPVSFIELSLPAITKSSATTGADKARQTKADVPSRKTLYCLGFVETSCDMVAR